MLAISCLLFYSSIGTIVIHLSFVTEIVTTPQKIAIYQ